jgi:hypothetical protein
MRGPVDAIPAAELRAWLLELRASLAPESIAGCSEEVVLAGIPFDSRAAGIAPRSSTCFVSLPPSAHAKRSIDLINSGVALGACPGRR